MCSYVFRRILDHHGPLKIKRVRDNQAKLMIKELSNSVMNRSKWIEICTWNSHLVKITFLQLFKSKSENVLSWKRHRKQSHGKWKALSTVKSSLTSNGFIQNQNMSIEIKNQITEDDFELLNKFNLLILT